MVVAGAVLLVIVFVRRGTSDVHELLAVHRRPAVLAGLCTGGYQALYFASVLSLPGKVNSSSKRVSLFRC